MIERSLYKAREIIGRERQLHIEGWVAVLLP